MGLFDWGFDTADDSAAQPKDASGAPEPRRYSDQRDDKLSVEKPSKQGQERAPEQEQKGFNWRSLFVDEQPQPQQQQDEPKEKKRSYNYGTDFSGSGSGCVCTCSSHMKRKKKKRSAWKEFFGVED
jgi:hypothetical protein